jgi:hypothetical protein
VGRDRYSDDIDWYVVGSTDEPAEPVGAAPPRQPWPRWFTLAVAAALIVGVVAAVNRDRRTPRVTVGSPTSVSSTPVAPRTSTPRTSTPRTSAPATVPPSAAVSVTRLGHPLLGTTAGWELFGRGDGVLVRIQPAAGQITRTTIPGLQSGSPVFMVAGSDRVVIRPLDNVPGYLVVDGKPARQLPPLLNQGPVLPGPAPNQMWIQPTDDHEPVMALVTLAGARLASFIRIPPGSSAFDAAPDGAGYLLFSAIGGVYDARPDGLRRISTGALLAVGPTGWLVVECDEQYRCQTVLIGRVGGSRRVVNAGPASRDLIGAISPDGTTAAMLTSGSNGGNGLYLLDLVSGRRRVVQVSLNQDSFYAGISFSPDSSLLFAVAADGKLAVINRRTGAVGTLGAPLPALTQLILRPAR